MAKDILALGIDGEDPTPPPPPPAASVDEITRPRAVPDLDLMSVTTEWTSSSPMAPDFFISSARGKSKKKLWKISR
jgi:hypothetical protein